MIRGEREHAPISLFPLDILYAYKAAGEIKRSSVVQTVPGTYTRIGYYELAGRFLHDHWDFISSIEDVSAMPAWDMGDANAEKPYHLGTRLVTHTVKIKTGEQGLVFPRYESEQDFDPYLLARDAHTPEAINTYSEEGREHYRQMLRDDLFALDPALEVLYEEFASDFRSGSERSAYIYGLDAAYHALFSAWRRQQIHTSSI